MILLGNPKYNYLITGDHPPKSKSIPRAEKYRFGHGTKIPVKTGGDPVFCRLYKDGSPTLSLKRFLFH